MDMIVLRQLIYDVAMLPLQAHATMNYSGHWSQDASCDGQGCHETRLSLFVLKCSYGGILQDFNNNANATADDVERATAAGCLAAKAY